MENIESWFILRDVPGVGNLSFKKLVERFKTPEKALQASSEELLQVNGMSQRLVSAIKNYKISDRVKQDIDIVVQRGYKIVTMLDSDYPQSLLNIPDPPPFLYVHGHLSNSIKNIAVVGSRNATNYGVAVAKRLCAELASFDITIVSGMALGIDTAAHEGALKGNGRTIAVLGSGLEEIYPAKNKGLFHKIAENGAVISEFPVLLKPEAHNFPIRNRIISGMCLGVVVIEATKKSGSLITARLANEQGREVFAVPGNIYSFKSKGTHNLIKQGAKLVENAQDILEEFSFIFANNVNKNKTAKQLPDLSSEEMLVFKLLGPYSIHIDDLVRKTSIDPGKLSGILLQLELKEIVQQAPGKLFSSTLEN